MKKSIGLFVILFVISVLFSAGSVLADDEPVHLVMWIQSADPFVAAHTAIAEQYMAEHPNVTVEIQKFPFADLSTKLVNAMVSETGCDIFEGYAPYMTTYMRAGKLSAVPESFAMKDDMVSKYYESALSMLEYEGTYYGIPSNIAAGSTRVLLVNDNLVEQAAVDLSNNTTFEDWIKTWQALTQYDKNGEVEVSGLGLYCGQPPDHFVSYLMEYGGQVTTDDGKKAAFNSEAGKKALQMISDLFNEYKVDTINISDSACVPQNTAASSYRGTWVIPEYANAFPDFKWHYELLPLPTGADVDVWQGGSGWATYVPAFSPQQDAAWAYMKYLDDNRKMWIENTGEIPANKELAAVMAEENPELYGAYYPILDQSKHGYPFGDYFVMQDTFQNMVNSVLYGEASVDEALTDAETTINAHLETWWAGL